ncbi:hypothetical protein GCM10018954_090450 [Kutzneria kofuensis]
MTLKLPRLAKPFSSMKLTEPVWLLPTSNTFLSPVTCGVAGLAEAAGAATEAAATAAARRMRTVGIGLVWVKSV